MTRDINHIDDSTEACEAFKERSSGRPHPEVPKMVADYRAEAAPPLFTNHTTPRP